jgi:hypothetical protein
MLFLGDLARDPRNFDLSDRPGPLIIQISDDAEGHEGSRQKYTEQSIIVHGTQSSPISYLGSQRLTRKSVHRTNINCERARGRRAAWLRVIGHVPAPKSMEGPGVCKRPS